MKTLFVKGLEPKSNVILTYPISIDVPPPKISFPTSHSPSQVSSSTTTSSDKKSPGDTPGDTGDDTNRGSNGAKPSSDLAPSGVGMPSDATVATTAAGPGGGDANSSASIAGGNGASPSKAKEEIQEGVVSEVGGSGGGNTARLKGDMLVLAVGQCRQMGRMVNVCPDALLDDGLLDVVVTFGSLGEQVRDGD